ncbi:MAG: translation initiation factor IF-2 [Phycisphaerales bacterium]|nr:MAG: translation initiation factor IF-2 [Phycisphaerales bacterium]
MENGLANKRVFEIAKELDVASKAIVAKCHDEGIPADVIKNHMSTVSIGLEVTIREWFRGGAGGESDEGGTDTEAESGGGTAVETAAKVDLAKVRAKPKARARAKAKPVTDEPKSPEPGEGDTPASSEPVRAPSAPPLANPSQASPAQASPSQTSSTQASPASPGSAPTPTPDAPDADQAAETPTQAPLAPAASAPATEAPQDAGPGAGAHPSRPGEARDGDRDGSSGVQPGSRPGGEAGSGGGRGPARLQPAPMNVPNRPKVITPAGPQLKDRQKVTLSGPKVVRVEAPEQLEAPRPRRQSGGFGGGRGPGGGPGFAPDAPPGDDRGRSPRRGGGGGGGGGGGPRGGKGGSRPGPGGGEGLKEFNRNRGGAGVGWSEQDLAERELRLQKSGGYLKQRRQQLRRSGQAPERAATLAQTGGKASITAPFTIKDLSGATGVKGADIVKKLFMQGVIATINSGIDAEKAQEVMMEWDIELEVVQAKSAEEVVQESFSARESVDERPRGPVVTILGHVDHGKTSLLDKIRNANVAAGEAGGITQATSAFRVPVRVSDEEKQIVFLDTPGHQAFTAMRARGAHMTDVIVLVVAADDGVMPQTAESISHAKAAGVPIVVALNKIDKPEATDSNVQRVLGQLAEHGLNPAEWGGDTEVIRTSAITGQGVDELLETLDYQSQLLDLKADFGGAARGTVIEARQEEGRGAVANILLQDGELRVGQFIVAGRGFGRVRDITDDRGSKLKSALPPMPVQISGIDEIPNAGDHFFIVDTLRKAQDAAEQRRAREREAQLAQPKVTLDTMFTRMAESELKEILVVLKADVQGSMDVLKNEIEKVSGDEVKVRVLHSAIGGVTESDVLLADASKAIIVGFNVIPSGKARSLAENKGVEIRTYDVIYHITEDITKAAEGLLKPELRQEILGHAEVRRVFKVSKVGAIAGCYVTDGVVQRDALIRVTRQDIVIENDRRLEQLKRFKDDAKEVRSNMECGMKIVGYDDIKEGDILECYKNVEVKRSL